MHEKQDDRKALKALARAVLPEEEMRLCEIKQAMDDAARDISHARHQLGFAMVELEGFRRRRAESLGSACTNSESATSASSSTTSPNATTTL